jgi:hypothetical protein
MDEIYKLMEKRLDSIQLEVRDLKAVVYGDTARRVEGLLEQLAAMRQEFTQLRKDLGELLSWRREMTTFMKVALGLLGVGGGASVINVLQAWLGGN